MNIKMKIINIVLLIFSVSLAQANNLKDETDVEKRQPQVLQLESVFLACSPCRLKNNLSFGRKFLPSIGGRKYGSLVSNK